MEIPKICRYCGGVVRLAPAAEVYGVAAARRLGIEREKFYQCQNCNARVGCHKGTTRPLGNLANETLRLKRKERGLSQEELASRLHVVRQTISKWEKGMSVSDSEQLIKIAVILETTVSELLGTQVENEEEPNRLAKELSRINTQLAIRNHRTRRVLKIIAVALLVFVALIFAIMALNYAPMPQLK